MERSKKDNTYCCVPQCNTVGTKEPNVSFHLFPLESNEFQINRRNSWIRILRIGKEVSHRMSVCSKHFKPSDYILPGFPSKRPRLKRTAVPSLYLPSSSAEISQFVGKEGIKVKVNEDSEMFNKQKSISREDQELVEQNSVCELHFLDKNTDKFYKIKLPKGSINTIEKDKPFLKFVASPKINPNFPAIQLSKNAINKLSAVKSPEINNSEIIESEHESSVNEDSSVEIENGKHELSAEHSLAANVPSVAGCLTFNKLLQSVDLIKKPNHWWSVNTVVKYIICARWNSAFTPEKRVVIDDELNVKVFLKDWEICISDHMELTSIDDISSLLEKIEDYRI